MPKIKVCGLCDSENIKRIAEVSPDFMGFIFYPESGRFAGEKVSRDLLSQIPAGIIKTGVFVNERIEIVKKTVNQLGLNAIQLHGSESTEYCRFLKSEGFITIKAFGIQNGFDFNTLIPYQNSCNYFLFDTKTEAHGGSGKKFNWSMLDKYKLDKHFFLSGGISCEDIREIRYLKNKGFYAIDINSRFELSPGIKDVELIRSFINEIKE